MTNGHHDRHRNTWTKGQRIRDRDTGMERHMAAVTATGTWQQGDTGGHRWTQTKKETVRQTDTGTWGWGQMDMGTGGQTDAGTRR